MISGYKLNTAGQEGVSINLLKLYAPSDSQNQDPTTLFTMLCNATSSIIALSSQTGFNQYWIRPQQIRNSLNRHSAGVTLFGRLRYRGGLPCPNAGGSRGHLRAPSGLSVRKLLRAILARLFLSHHHSAGAKPSKIVRLAHFIEYMKQP